MKIKIIIGAAAADRRMKKKIDIIKSHNIPPTFYKGSI